MNGLLCGVGPMKLGSRFSWVAVPTLGIAVLAITAPIHAQSDQGLILVLPECDTRMNPQDNDTADATFNFGDRRTSAGAASDGVGAENDVPPQASGSNPFATFRKSWERRNAFSVSFCVMKASTRSNATHPEPGAQGSRPYKDFRDSSTPILQDDDPTDRNRSIYYKNKVEFSLEGGWLPINIPFPFDFLLGSGYNFPGLYYTLVPIFASVRWQVDDIGGHGIWRGNWDVTFTGSVTAIPRGAETRYFSYIMGIRRNFVPRRLKVAPYLDGQLGLGEIDAKGPLGVAYAQGQSFTFTLNLGSGLRYNFNPRYAIQAGVHYMHISNLYLSEPRFLNYGINVYGPMVGIDVRLGKR
jgi:hypothetical protein